MLMIFVKVVADAEVSNLCAVKYDNAMYTTKLPDLVEEEVVDVDKEVEEHDDEIDTSFIDQEDAEIRYLIRHFAKSGKL